MTELARDYVAKYMSERYTPEQLVKKKQEISDFIDSLPEIED